MQYSFSLPTFEMPKYVRSRIERIGCIFETLPAVDAHQGGCFQ
jgi:hypothetical protein